jgi:hypothetical protein
MKTKGYLAAAFVTVLVPFILFPGPARASCGEDCDSSYQSEVDSCSLTNDAPEDGEDLSLCVQSAKDDYQSCLDDCVNQNE